jgi:hypothetical protein
MRGVCRLWLADWIVLGKALKERQTRNEDALGGLTAARFARR